MKQTWLLDIECYISWFFIGIRDYKNKKEITFEVSEYKDERKELIKALSTFDGYLVTFNGISYDNTVIAYIIKEQKRLLKLSIADFLYAVKEFSNNVIEDNFELIKTYRWWKKPWIDIDLYLYWAKSLRISKKISLKSLGIQLGHPEIEELPYEHTKVLNKEEMERVKRYNLVNDLGILELLFEKMKPDIQLRHYIQQEYGISCWSMDAPKIGSEYLLLDYCTKTHNDYCSLVRENIPLQQYINEVRKERYIPSSFKIGDYLPRVDFKTKIFQDLYLRFCNSEGSFYEEFAFNKNDTSIMLLPSQGGVHSSNDNQYWMSDENWTIIDADIASLYPTLLEKYRFLRDKLTIVLEKYISIKADRINAKRAGDKMKDTFLKLVLNSFTGLADSNVTWLYSPEHLLALRVFGQLIQLRFIEELSLLDGIKVFFTNTDGTCCLVRNDRINDYYKIANSISKEFQVEWEFTINSKMAFANTNNYISVVEKSFMLDESSTPINIVEKTKVKKKGFFKYGDDIPLGDSVNELVIPQALELYFIKDIPLEESITNPEKYGFHIYHYCKSNKISKEFDVIYKGSKIQNLNRYYFSKASPFLFKKKKSKSTLEHINVGEGVTIFNKYEEKPWSEYNINYSTYIAKARKIVDSIENSKRQLKLF